jgi:hypothetical protein
MRGRRLVAWANEKGVKIYDTEAEKFITYIDRPKKSPRPDMYRCNLCWEDDTTLLIGWADSIKIGKVKVCCCSSCCCYDLHANIGIVHRLIDW